MKSLRAKIDETKKHPHCANCGKINPQLLEEGDLANSYTRCCDEAVCRCLEEFKFGNKNVKVRACCWGVAEMEFLGCGVDIEGQDGMHRFSDEE